MRTKSAHLSSTTFDRACALIETALTGDTRREIVAAAAQSPDLGGALLRLRESLRAHVLKAGARKIDLHEIVTQYDRRTRDEGFHVLHDWDGKADAVNEDIIPVDVLDFVGRERGAQPVDRTALAILLDYYLLNVLALLSLRVWDEGDADDRLDRLNALLRALQGPDGSGQPFVADAETLILIATSHYELEERGFGGLLEKVRTLNPAHRAAVAVGHAASLGSHLRFGFEATYARDTVVMRDDNVADYPWLCFSLATLMDEYARLHDAAGHGVERDRVVEGLLNGLSPDAGAFVGRHPPRSLSACEAERSAFSERFHAYRQDLLDEFERHRPSGRAYSPLSFFFNFSHNVLKGIVIDALLWGAARHLSLNDLLTGIPDGAGEGEAKAALAGTLMGYSRSSPDRIRGRLMPVIVFDPAAGHQAFALTMRKARR